MFTLPVMYSGIKHVTVSATIASPSFPVLVQYPTLLAPQGAQVGPYQFEATHEAAIAEGRFPICLISHGGGGSHLLYRTIATHLARNGYIVASLEHPGDNRNDRSLCNTDLAAERRPGQVSSALDAVLTNPFFQASTDASRICVIGHSMGGYTALALLGGQPWSRTGVPLKVKSDQRFTTAVLLAPATDWFLAPGALAAVSAPMLVMTGEHDEFTPTAKIARALAGLPTSTPFVLHEVQDAGHYAFLSPFPPTMRSPDFPPALDPVGFDRDAFHLRLPNQILAFLANALPR